MLADVLVQINMLGRTLFTLSLLLLVVEGCQQRPTTVSGTVTLDGKPLTIASDARGTIVFNPDGGRGTVATGLLDATGHFDLATGSSNEIAPGTYYVTVSVARLLPASDQGEQGSQLVTPAKYASARESGLAATVVPGENHFSFDLRWDVRGGSSLPAEMPADKPEANNAPPDKDPTEKTDR
jgi:hypothetical protein